MKMSKNSVKTILITLYLSAVQDPEPLLNGLILKETYPLNVFGSFLDKNIYNWVNIGIIDPAGNTEWFPTQGPSPQYQ